MYHLPCIPPEYDDFLIYIPDISIKSLCTTVVHWCSKKQEELNEFGERAKQFILKNKNSVIQTKKIIDLIEAL
jgi:hypothetical protein